jgi:hypothetical protein
LKAGVTSHGPYAGQEELQRLCEAGYRGKYAQMVSQIGRGLGLSLLAAICAHHEVEVEISSDNTTVDFNVIPYSEFTVVLHFKKA